MALQTANQFQLAPNIASNLGGGVKTGQNIAGQFQLGKQRDQQIQQTEEDATVKRFLNSALELSTVPDDQKLSALKQNRAAILARGGETSDTDAGIALAEAGDFETLNNEIQGIITNGERRGLIKPLSALTGVTSSQKERTDLLEAIKPALNDDGKIDLGKLDAKSRSAAMALGLIAKSGTITGQERIAEDPNLTENIATSQAVIEKKKAAAKETGKLSSQLELKPKVDAAVVTAVSQAKFDADIKTEDRSNQKAFDVYNAAKTNLVSALGGTITGPGAGWIPALTADAQIANGAVAMMAPVLKQLFRASGEGTFTDKDQEMLIAMVPTRSTLPEARVVQLAAIDSIVSAKLGNISEEAKVKTGQKKAEAPIQQKQGGQVMVDANGNRAMVFPDGSFEEL